MVAALLAGALALALLVAMLAIPVRVSLRVTGVEVPEGELAIQWLFGLVRVRRRWPRASARPGAPQARPFRTARERTRRGRPDLLGLLKQERFRQRIWKLLNDLAAAVQVRELRLHLRLGLGDPADTGRLWPLLGLLGTWAAGVRGADVHIEPDFTGEAFEFRVQARVVAIPLQCAALVLGFVLSPASVRAWQALRAAHA